MNHGYSIIVNGNKKQVQDKINDLLNKGYKISIVTVLDTKITENLSEPESTLVIYEKK